MCMEWRSGKERAKVRVLVAKSCGAYSVSD